MREDRLPRTGGHLHRGRPARGGGRAASSSRCARRPSTTRSSRSSAARRSGRWSPSRTRSRARCAAPSTPSPSRPTAVTIVGEHDYAVRAHLIAREPLELERDRGGPLPPPAARPVRPLPARAAAGRRAAQRQQHGRGGAAGLRVGRALGGDRRPRGGRALRLHDPARGDRGRGRQRHPLRLDRPGGHRAAAARGRGRPRSSSPSSARTTPAPWSTPCASSPAARST